MPHSYYDIDGILAEEELIPCTTLFEFSHLGDLDPDGTHHEQQQEENGTNNSGGGESSTFLPENSRIKVPLWAVDKWAVLGFVRLQLPRHYRRRARERYDADPADANLRKRNERFFLSGRRLVHLIEESSTEVAKAIAKLPRRNSSNSMIRHTQALKLVSEEARALRRTLLQTYAGERLRKVFDWSQSSGSSGGSNSGSGDYDDDVSGYLNQLTEMEQRLYYAGSSAVADLEEWKLFGNRRLWKGPTQKTTTKPITSDSPRNNDANRTDSSKSDSHKRSVTPGDEPTGQRRRLQ